MPFSEFLSKPYNVNHSPQIGLKSEEPNCQLLTHQLYQARIGVQIPLGMWSKEIHDDETLIFQTVTQLQFEADIVIFGRRGDVDPRNFHLAYFTGEFDQGEPLLIHATAYEGKVVISPLSWFFTKPRYEELKRIKRLQPHLLTAAC